MTSVATFTDSELEQIKSHFAALDQDGDGHLTHAEVLHCLRQLNLVTKDQEDTFATQIINEVDANQNGTIEFQEFLNVCSLAKAGDAGTQQNFLKFHEASKDLIKVQGASGVHSFAQAEMTAFSNHINNCLQNDPELKYLLPIDSSGTELATKISDGVLLAKFINIAVRDTIDERALNKRKVDGKDLSTFQINENLNLVISAAKSIGVSTVNVGATELRDGQHHPHLVLGLVWQLVKIQLLNSINLKNHPELVRLLEDGEELADLLRLPPDQLLLRWFNYHLKNAGSSKRVTNFSGDVKDSEAYTILLHQIAPNTCDNKALSMTDKTQRAQAVLVNAGKLNVHSFIKASDIVSGNSRLNLAFTAAIFNQCPGLDPLTEEEIEKAGLMDDDVGDSREERAFRMWMNSLGIPDFYIHSLFEDCRDGLALLKVMDKIEPGIVSWKAIEMKPTNRFKKVSNCNQAVLLGKQMKFSLVNIQGSDLVDGNKKLLLGLVWQLMRYHTLKFVAQVNESKLGTGPITDQMVVDWANDKVSSAGRSSKMASFKDPSLSNSLFFFDLIYAINSQIIDWDIVTPGTTDEERILNARYVISVARKLQATIFLLPEDIVEVKPKMILTFVASLMAIA